MSKFHSYKYMEIEIRKEEKLVIAPSPQGMHILKRLILGLQNGGIIRHYGQSELACSTFTSPTEIEEVFHSPLAHSQWFIELNEVPARAWFDFDDDLCIFIFENTISNVICDLIDVEAMCIAAEHEGEIIRGVAREEKFVKKFEYFLSQMLQPSDC